MNWIHGCETVGDGMALGCQDHVTDMDFDIWSFALRISNEEIAFEDN